MSTPPQEIPFLRNSLVRHAIAESITATQQYTAGPKVECAGATAVVLSIRSDSDLANRVATVSVYASTDGGSYWTLFRRLASNTANTATDAEVTHVSEVAVNAADARELVAFDPRFAGAITHFAVDIQIVDAGGAAGTVSVDATVLR